jgi:NADPH2:quinone reductase
MSTQSHMKVTIAEIHGAPLRLATVSRSTPGAGQVVLRIHASGVNPLDTRSMRVRRRNTVLNIVERDRAA